MGSIINWLALSVRRRCNFIPKCLKRFVLRHVHLQDAVAAWYISKDKLSFVGAESNSSYDSPYPYRLGIIKEFWERHWPYVAACRDLRLAYQILDISGPDWMEVVENSRCDVFLVTPSGQLSIWKQMYDERLKVIVKDLGKIIYPSYKEIWFYESKRRMNYWLKANNIPHPQTWIYYGLDAAIDFARACDLPVVVKTNMGYGSAGVRIFRKRADLLRYVNRIFKKGIIYYDGASRDKEWGTVFFQEYLREAKEWRIVRIGDSYFGYEKLKSREFHSGSLQRSYSGLSDELLYFAKNVMDIGDFKSMDLDIFETNDGRYLVNELQMIFGMSRPEMYVSNGRSGRIVLRPESNSWQFEAGDFCRNYLCNLRVESLLSMLDKRQTSTE